MTRTLLLATPLILTGLAAAVAFRMRVWNIGAEGQLYMEAIVSAIVAGTPILFATLGEILTERSGVMNLGVEGMMLIGGVTGFWAGSRPGTCGLRCWPVGWPGSSSARSMRSWPSRCG